MCMHACMHAYTYTYTYIYIYAYVYIYILPNQPPKIQQGSINDQIPAEGEQPPTASKDKSASNNQQGKISNNIYIYT